MDIKNIALIFISTWKYNQFIDNVILSAKKFFLTKSNVDIILFTDSTSKHNAHHVIKIKHKPWPLMTLKRYETILEHKNIYDNYDYIFYIDVDSIINDSIDETILNHNLVVVEHCGWRNTTGTPETNPISTAYIDPKNIKKYIAGGFVGGKRDEFLSLCDTLSKNINIDYSNNFIARWHDESHLNRYVLDNINNVKILDYKYLYIYCRKKTHIDNPTNFKIISINKNFQKC